MSDTPAGWNFSDSGSVPWQPMGDGIAMKTLGMAGGRMMATFQFQPGYEGGVHEHTDAEFTYILEGSLISQGVLMTAGHAYAAEPGTTHDDFRTETGCTLVSVFPVPGG